MEKIKGGELQEYIGVLIELFEMRDGSMTPCIMLQTTDEKEYRIIEGQDPSRFLRQRVRIIGRLHLTEGEKVLEILQVTPVELSGSLQAG
ncbi:MAG TPA: DUF5818 domain-containing protein [Desulfobacteraceae bacterium]|nr:DUF5818 domain-containing protein [Desulfobacteraceae bacterium]